MIFLLFYIIKGNLVTVVKHDLFVHQVLEVFFAKGELLKVKVEGTYKLSRGFVIREMQLL